MQTLTVAIEWLTQWNHELEWQLKQWNDQELNNQNEEQERDERDNNRPSMNNHQKRDNQEESNAINRRDQQDTSRPSELEVSVLHMTQETQTMKEKMDMMMNALKGRVCTSSDKLVHRTDSPFTASVTSFPLPTKFRKLQVDAYNRSNDPLDHLESFKTLMHL